MVQEMARALHLTPAVFSVILISALLISAVIVGFILNRILAHWAKSLSSNTWKGLFFSLLEPLPVPLLILVALYGGMEALTLPTTYERLGSKLIRILLVLVLFYFPAKVLILFLRRLGEREPGLRQVTQPAAFVARALFALLAVIIILENLGISLTGIWTTLGVGSVAVALALQETLSNLFAGLYLLADRPITSGDYIKIDSGQEGFTVKIGWRSTTLRTRFNNVVVIPNSTLAKAVITNYSMPEPWMTIVIPVGVAYDSDARRVERVLTEIAENAVREGLEGLLTNPQPFVRLVPGFGDSALNFSVVVHVRDFGDQDGVQSELRKRILERFKEEGIQMPFPTRSIVLDKSTVDRLARSQPKT
jgi:small-conductance mechanosensitive channel